VQGNVEDGKVRMSSTRGNYRKGKEKNETDFSSFLCGMKGAE
jgi:hypothetical protein